jgi:hypothetical protein
VHLAQRPQDQCASGFMAEFRWSDCDHYQHGQEWP